MNKNNIPPKRGIVLTLWEVSAAAAAIAAALAFSASSYVGREVATL